MSACDASRQEQFQTNGSQTAAVHGAQQGRLCTALAVVVVRFFENKQQVMGIYSCAATVQVGTAARSTVLSSTGGNSMRDNIVNVFGARLADGLVPVHAETAGGSKLEG